MLTADLVNVRRRGDELHLVAIQKDARARAVSIAEDLIAVVREHLGRSEEELTRALSSVVVEARDFRLKEGMTKLLLDRCEWGAPTTLEPEEVRRQVFSLASARRAALEPGVTLDREVILAEVADTMACSTDQLEASLFSDLRGAQLLTKTFTPEPEALVSAYERGQAQAVLLRAVKISVHLEGDSVAAMRPFFRRLKFLQLLHSIGKTDTGYRVEIDGPFSLFESVTRYGQKLAMVLPALEGSFAFRLEADVRWGKEKRALVFRMQGEPTAAYSAESALPDDAAALLRAFSSLSTTWRGAANTKLLELPGVGLVIPDLVFKRIGDDGKPIVVYLEVMGFWSRAAVWKRVELVQAGLGERVLFAVSSRLRVSEEVLGDDLPGALYVYKGAMSARAIVERLDKLASSPARGSPRRNENGQPRPKP